MFSESYRLFTEFDQELMWLGITASWRREGSLYNTATVTATERSTEEYKILVFQSRPRAVVKNDRSGKVFFDK